MAASILCVVLGLLISSATAQTMTLWGYADAFCATETTWNQTYNAGQCYPQMIPKLNVKGSYTSTCTVNPTANQNCASLVNFGSDSTCNPGSAVRPETFPCDTCISILPLVYFQITGCATGNPVYESLCDSSCGTCLSHTPMSGACTDLETLGGGYYSLGNVSLCPTIMTFSNYLGRGCDGHHLYSQPVPVGLCVNGTMAQCSP